MYFSRYPYVNENVAESWPSLANNLVTKAIRALSDQAYIHSYGVAKHFLGDLCIHSPRRSWTLHDDVLILDCSHSGMRRTSCAITHDLIALASLLENGLRDEV